MKNEDLDLAKLLICADADLNLKTAGNQTVRQSYVAAALVLCTGAANTATPDYVNLPSLFCLDTCLLYHTLRRFFVALLQKAFEMAKGGMDVQLKEILRKHLKNKKGKKDKLNLLGGGGNAPKVHPPTSTLHALVGGNGVSKWAVAKYASIGDGDFVVVVAAAAVVAINHETGA